MRARQIRPGFFTNETLAECQALARILFAGLWCMADREGRLEDRPARIKAQLLPYDNCDISLLLDELSERGFLERYEANGVKVVVITKFKSNQKIHPGEAPSQLPAPNKQKRSTKVIVEEHLGAPQATPRCDADNTKVIAEEHLGDTSPGKGDTQSDSYSLPSLTLTSSLSLKSPLPLLDEGTETQPDSERVPEATETEGEKTPKYDPKTVELPPSLDTQRFRSVWEEWCDYRAERKPKLTPRSVKKQLKDFAEWGETAAIDAINAAIRNGYQGVFIPDKRKVSSNGRQTHSPSLRYDPSRDDQPDGNGFSFGEVGKDDSRTDESTG